MLLVTLSNYFTKIRRRFFELLKLLTDKQTKAVT